MSKMFNAYIIKEMDSGKEKKQTYSGKGIKLEEKYGDEGEEQANKKKEKNKKKLDLKKEESKFSHKLGIDPGSPLIGASTATYILQLCGMQSVSRGVSAIN